MMVVAKSLKWNACTIRFMSIVAIFRINTATMMVANLQYLRGREIGPTPFFVVRDACFFDGGEDDCRRLGGIMFFLWLCFRFAGLPDASES